MEKTFNYAGHTFKGVRQFSEGEDFFSISRRMFSLVNDLSCKWSWKEFFGIAEQVSSEDFDIFLMDGKFCVLPAHNGLFIYGKDEDIAYKKYLEAEKHFKSLNEAHDTYAVMLLKGIRQYTGNHGPVETLDGDFVPFVMSCKDGIVTEEVKRVLLTEDGKLCIVTDADIHTEADGHFSTMNLTAVLEFIYRFRNRKTGPADEVNETQSEICKLMEQKYQAYQQQHGKEPLYASCLIQFKDNMDTLEVTVKMASNSENEEDNESVFFFCDTFSGLKGLTDPDNMTDFYIKDFFYFC